MPAHRTWSCLAALALAASAAPARAAIAPDLRLLEDDLSLPPLQPASLEASPDLSIPRLPVVRVADEKAGDQADAKKKPKEKAPAAEPGSLDFDLLGAAKPPPESADLKALKTRRTMLTWHQGVGFGLFGLHLATTVVGQLNYNDKFGGSAPDNTNRFRLSHAVLAYTTLGVFAVNGVVALLAPSPLRKLQLDRVMVHRIAMGAATAGMIAQAIYGIQTANREGYNDQKSIARTHLVIGYATFAALATGVGVLVF